MPVMVTGGTGHLGVNLIRSLVQDGHHVRALVRPISSRKGLDLPGIEFVTGDVTDIDSVRSAMNGCDQAYHLAGWVRITPWGLEQATAVNVRGTENVCRACLEQRVPRLVHISSIAAIGLGSASCPATEQTPWDMHRESIPYYRTKRQAEEVVKRFLNEGLDAVIVNPSYTVGPYDVKPTGGRVIILIATRRLRGYPARGGIAVVDVREVIDGMRRAMESGRCGQRYILAGENISHRDWARRIAKIAGVKPPRWGVSHWLLHPAAVLAAAGRRAFPDLAEDFNPAMLRVGFCEQYVSADKARRELGVYPRPIDLAVADALAWFEQNQYLTRTSRGWAPGPQLPVRP